MGERTFHTQVSVFLHRKCFMAESEGLYSPDAFFGRNYLQDKKKLCKLLIGTSVFIHHSVESDTFIFWTELKFSKLSPESSPNHVSSAAATSMTMADKLLISVSQHQTRSDK